VTAFLLACTLNGIATGGIHFEDVNICIGFKDKLNNQSFMKDNTPQRYECMCKLVPFVDKEKVRVY
jgi:hypothetical protein|tara:strand:+ start:485 stop:682 length:198 start_codon:yes stop_codon:yes gene_type:complete